MERGGLNRPFLIPDYTGTEIKAVLRDLLHSSITGALIAGRWGRSSVSPIGGHGHMEIGTTAVAGFILTSASFM